MCLQCPPTDQKPTQSLVSTKKSFQMQFVFEYICAAESVASDSDQNLRWQLQQRCFI
jgi:hypothetical protein